MERSSISEIYNSALMSIISLPGSLDESGTKGFGFMRRPTRSQCSAAFILTGQKSMIIRFMAVQTGVVLRMRLPAM